MGTTEAIADGSSIRNVRFGQEPHRSVAREELHAEIKSGIGANKSSTFATLRLMPGFVSGGMAVIGTTSNPTMTHNPESTATPGDSARARRGERGNREQRRPAGQTRAHCGKRGHVAETLRNEAGADNGARGCAAPDETLGSVDTFERGAILVKYAPIEA